MCWSLEASAASLVAGLWAPAALLWFLGTADIPSAVARLCTAVVAVLVLPGFVQLGDTLSHLNERELWTTDTLPVAGFTYGVIALQPAVLAWGVAGCLESAALHAVLVLVGVVVALHFLGCLAFDAPLSRWLTIEVVRREGSAMCAIVHGFYAYEGGCSTLFGLNARVGSTSRRCSASNARVGRRRRRRLGAARGLLALELFVLRGGRAGRRRHATS